MLLAKMIHQIADEVRQVILGQPVTQTGWQQKVLLGKVKALGLCH